MELETAARALRLNRSFPDVDRFVTHLRHAAALGDPPDPHTGMPPARAWSRVRAEAQTAAERLASLHARAPRGLPAEAQAELDRQQRRLTTMASAELLPARQVQVQLRHREGAIASYRVTVDRLDVATALAARYTIILQDQPGARVPEGRLALRASEAFTDRLELLGTQDAAMAFAALQAEGLDVHEVVRGAIGPAVQGAAGPQLLPLTRPALSAVLERASRDLEKVRVDDPLPDAVTLPTAQAGFGLVAARKWAVASPDLGPVKAWFRARGLRALVYPYVVAGSVG